MSDLKICHVCAEDIDASAKKCPCCFEWQHGSFGTASRSVFYKLVIPFLFMFFLYLAAQFLNYFLAK